MGATFNFAIAPVGNLTGVDYGAHGGESPTAPVYFER